MFLLSNVYWQFPLDEWVQEKYTMSATRGFFLFARLQWRKKRRSHISTKSPCYDKKFSPDALLTNLVCFYMGLQLHNSFKRYKLNMERLKINHFTVTKKSVPFETNLFFGSQKVTQWSNSRMQKHGQATSATTT